MLSRRQVNSKDSTHETITYQKKKYSLNLAGSCGCNCKLFTDFMSGKGIQIWSHWKKRMRCTFLICFGDGHQWELMDERFVKKTKKKWENEIWPNATVWSHTVWPGREFARQTNHVCLYILLTISIFSNFSLFQSFVLFYFIFIFFVHCQTLSLVL